jgi:tetratricopeptide (TPR) repeat protein
MMNFAAVPCCGIHRSSIVFGVDAIAELRRSAEDERHRGNRSRAADLYRQVIALLRESDEPLRLAHAIRHLGDVYFETGDVEAAGNCYSEALQIYRDHPAPKPLDLANAVRSMAVLKDTAEWWDEARRLYEVAGVEEAVLECSRRLARLTNGSSR